MNREYIAADQQHRIVATTDGKSIALLPPATPQSLNNSACSGSLNAAIAAIAAYSSQTLVRFQNPLFCQALIRMEALASARLAGIDGTVTDLMYDELFRSKQSATENHPRLPACVRSITSLVGVSPASRPLMSRLREAHALLSFGDPGSDPGVYRSDQIWNGSHRIEMARYVPPPATFLHGCVSDLEYHLSDSRCGKKVLALPLQLAVAHAQFSSIQPFQKWNGMIARMIAPLLTHGRGGPPLFLSSFWQKHACEYREALSILQLTGDWTRWITFYLDAIVQSVKKTISYIDSLDETKEIWKKKTTLLRQSSITQDVLDFIVYVPVFNVAILQKYIPSTYQVISRSIEFLVDVDIIKPLNTKKRNRVFLASDIIGLLS